MIPFIWCFSILASSYSDSYSVTPPYSVLQHVLRSRPRELVIPATEVVQQCPSCLPPCHCRHRPFAPVVSSSITQISLTPPIPHILCLRTLLAGAGTACNRLASFPNEGGSHLPPFAARPCTGYKDGLPLRYRPPRLGDSAFHGASPIEGASHFAAGSIGKLPSYHRANVIWVMAPIHLHWLAINRLSR